MRDRLSLTDEEAHWDHIREVISKIGGNHSFVISSWRRQERHRLLWISLYIAHLEQGMSSFV